jgi:hypothetical protein
MPGGSVNVDFEGREIPVDAYVDRGKQGQTEGLLLLPITLSPNLQGQGRAAQERVNVADKTVVMPPKETAYGSIEGLMNHFMHVMDGYGIRPPAGEAYFAAEGANGELGFYVVSDGGDRPYRVRCRPPCLPPVAALPRMIEGQMIADIIPTFGSVNMIAEAGPMMPIEFSPLERGREGPRMSDARNPQFTPSIWPRSGGCRGSTGQAGRPPARAPSGPGHVRVHLARGRGASRALRSLPAHVHEVVTFYTLFFQKPKGRHVVSVCHNLSCYLMNAKGIVQHLEERLGVAPGETTPDGRVTFLTVECLCACEQAPMMQVDDRYEGNLTPEKVDRILEGLR